MSHDPQHDSQHDSQHGGHHEDPLDDLHDDLLSDWQDTVELPLLEPLATTVALMPFPPPPPAPTPASADPWSAPLPANTWQAPLPQAWAQVPTTMVLSDRREPSTAVLAASWLLAVLTLGYLLPWAIAATRGRSNHGGVAIVALLLGWTGIGWAVALVMACSAHRPVLVQVFAPMPPLGPPTAFGAPTVPLPYQRGY